MNSLLHCVVRAPQRKVFKAALPDLGELGCGVLPRGVKSLE